MGLALIKWIFIGILLSLVLYSSIYKGIEQRDFSVTILDIGEKFFLATEKMNQESINLQKTGFSLDEKPIYSHLQQLSDLFSSIIMVVLWIALLAFIIGHSPLSDKDSWFTNYALALIFFYFLQVIIILGSAGINGELTGWYGSEKSVASCLKIPVDAFMNFFRLFKVFNPAIERLNQMNLTG